MTTIRYGAENGYITLQAAGHAGYSESGKDIVCAAVSTLTCCLAQYAQKHGGAAHQSEGYLNISMRDNRMTREVAEVIYAGLGEIAKQYPAYVRIL